jgi:signal transduction histidine kinase
MNNRRSAKPGLTRPQLMVFAHELRGALTIISGYSELLARELSDEDRTAALEGIQRASRRADGLVAAALAGDIEGAHIPFTELDLTQLATRVAEEQRAATGREVTVFARANPVVLGDGDALSRMLGNLIDNAAKYSPAPHAIEVEVERAQDKAVMTVSDRGPGISEADRERAFEPFERLEGAETTEGSGIGLAVVLSVARAHEGGAEILERTGGGTTIRIELPEAG